MFVRKSRLLVRSEPAVVDQPERTADAMRGRDATVEFVGKKASVEIKIKVRRGNLEHGTFFSFLLLDKDY